MNNKQEHAILQHAKDYLGDIILGVNDGLVSILGFVAGAYGAIENNLLVFITGVAATVAAALSMAAAVYLARKSEQELRKEKHPTASALRAGVATAIAFIFFSLFPLLPYLLVSGIQAFIVSIALTLGALFAAGALKTIITQEHTKWFLRGLEMMLIGATTALISYGVGVWIGNLTQLSVPI